jgi:hypothetical protein
VAHGCWASPSPRCSVRTIARLPAATDELPDVRATDLTACPRNEDGAQTRTPRATASVHPPGSLLDFHPATFLQTW